MPKYFTSHTKLAGMERMMMSSDRTGGPRTQRHRSRPREKPKAARVSNPSISEKKAKEESV